MALICIDLMIGACGFMKVYVVILLLRLLLMFSCVLLDLSLSVSRMYSVLLLCVMCTCLDVFFWIFPWLSDTGIWYVGGWQMLLITG